MPAERLSMRKIREVLRLHFACGLSKRRIARALGIGPTSAGEYLARARRAALAWPLPGELDDAALERLLFPPPPQGGTVRPEPEWAMLHLELRRPGVTLALLWEEYRLGIPRATATAVLRAAPRLGGPAVADDASASMSPARSCSSTIRGQNVESPTRPPARCARPRSSSPCSAPPACTYAEATWSQALPDWVGAHGRRSGFLGGVPRLIVPDYVTGHIIALLCRSTLCGQRRR